MKLIKCIIKIKSQEILGFWTLKKIIEGVSL